MWDRVRVVTPATVLPVNLVDAKAHLRVDGTDEDTLILHYLRAAVAEIEGAHGIGIMLGSQSVEVSLDRFETCISIPFYPVRSVAEIRYVDPDGVEQVLAPENYTLHSYSTEAIVEPAFNVSWPATRQERGAVRIALAVGYATAALVPADIRHAILMTVAHWYRNREDVTVGQAGNSMPHAVPSILNRYRVSQFS